MGFAEGRGKGKNRYFRARYKKLDGTFGTLPEKFRTKTDATNAARDEEARIRAVEVPYTDPREGLKEFGAWAEAWMAAKPKEPRTVERRWFLLDKLLLPRWGESALSAITWFDVEQWANSCDYDRGVVRDAITLMSGILTGAVDKKLIGYNLVAGRRWTPAPRPKGTPINRRGKKTAGKHKVVPTGEQALRVADRARNDTERLMVICATWLGLRYGELGALHRDNCLIVRVDRIAGVAVTRHVVIVDADKGELKEYTVRQEDRSGKSVLELGRPKSEAGIREVDVPPFLVELLRAYMKSCPHPYLFTSPSGRWWWRANWSEVLRPLCDGRPAPRKPEWRRLADALELRISQGEVVPGQRLPTLKELAAEYGIAVGTAQRAVAHLADRGVAVIRRGRGSGTVVAADALLRIGMPAPGDAALEPILPGLELHGCRHANDTRQEQCGVQDVMRRESLGHARERGMDGVYIHPTPEMRQLRLRVLEEWWHESVAAVHGAPSAPRHSPKRWENTFLSQDSPKTAKSIKPPHGPAGESVVGVNRIAL
ncbi:GntR family transcriptional regulator [Streptomycetaceae bacterium NBC_01309]